MSTKLTIITITIATVVLASLHLALLGFPGTVRGQVMQSTNYRIESDSVNFGGGLSTSSTYKLEDTAGEIATGESSSTNYRLGAGYQHTLLDYLSLSTAANVVMDTTIGGLTGGTSNGSTTVTVITDNAAGYQLTMMSSSSPALRSGAGDTIANYVPASGNPDFTFSTPASASRFGFSPEGADIAQRFKDNGSSCGVGSSDTALACWDAPSTTPIEIARRQSGNHPLGTQTTLRFRVGIGANAMIPEGVYTATTTITALPL